MRFTPQISTKSHRRLVILAAIAGSFAASAAPAPAEPRTANANGIEHSGGAAARAATAACPPAWGRDGGSTEGRDGGSTRGRDGGSTGGRDGGSTGGGGGSITGRKVG
jgi:hypothetical protein